MEEKMKDALKNVYEKLSDEQNLWWSSAYSLAPETLKLIICMQGE